MIKNKRILIICSVLFLLVEAALGIIIQIAPTPNNFQYLSVALACVFCFLFIEKTSSYLFTQIALLFTVGADFFLVFLNGSNRLAGMLFFAGTQIAYFLRIFFEETNLKVRKIHLILRIFAAIAILVATTIVLGEKTDALSLVSMFYYTNLILNIAFAFIHVKNDYLFVIGLILFAVCDTFIGLSNIGPYITISEGSLIYKLLNLEIDIAWIFYVPSQALLSISLLTRKLKKRV